MKYKILCVLVFFIGCSTPKQNEPNTHLMTVDDIMVIYENGYLNGTIRTLKDETAKKFYRLDSIRMRQRWERVVE